MAAIEVKVKKLDGELTRYMEQMKKLREGSGKVPSSFCSFSVLIIVTERKQSNNVPFGH
jgi:hypothetical protein